jgi:hypothetical protein
LINQKDKKMGIVKWFMNRYITHKIKNDKEVMGKLAEADKAAEQLKGSIADCEKRGLYVDPEIKKMVGLK